MLAELNLILNFRARRHLSHPVQPLPKGQISLNNVGPIITVENKQT